MLSAFSPSSEIKPLELSKFAGEINQFGYDLFQKLRLKDGNLFCSPYSINSCLAMAAVGARGNTAQQMTKVLHLPPNVSEFSSLHAGIMNTIRIANALWGQQDYYFSKEFVQQVQSLFRAEARSMDFKNKAEDSRLVINRWVEEQTKDLIKHLLPAGSVRSDTRLILTNAIYFKGDWEHPFQERWTKPQDFHLTSSSRVQSAMMNQTVTVPYSETSDWQAVELPYMHGRLAMVVLLPLKKHRLPSVEGNISTATLQQIDKGWQNLKVILTLPKIKTSYEAMLAGTLAGMGMTDAFSFGQADFSGCDGSRELYISDVVHKAFCEVNESGTEAAAATGTMMCLGSPVLNKEPPPKVFQADHPYLYLIRDRQTGTVLFLGRVSDPRS